jgi:hypothetical protein
MHPYQFIHSHEAQTVGVQEQNNAPFTLNRWPFGQRGRQASALYPPLRRSRPDPKSHRRRSRPARATKQCRLRI